MSEISARIAYLRERLKQRFDPTEHDELQRLVAEADPETPPAPAPAPVTDDDATTRRHGSRPRGSEIQSP